MSVRGQLTVRVCPHVVCGFPALVLPAKPKQLWEAVLMRVEAFEPSVLLINCRKDRAMFANVVVGVDGLDGGRDAVALAAMLAAPHARISLVHVGTVDAIQARASTLAADLADTANALAVAGRATSDVVHLEAFSVGAGLEAAAAERQADLIVVGSCHRGMVGRVLSGDDAASVLHHATRTVVIAPTGFRTHRVDRGVIGIAYDGSPESQIARVRAESLAKALGATVVARCVVMPHVYAAPVGAATYVEDPEALIARRRAELGDIGDMQLDFVVGPPGPELEAFSDEVDVLVCGCRHSGSLGRLLLGSTSDYLAHHAGCAVLITGNTTAPTHAAPQEQSVAVVG